MAPQDKTSLQLTWFSQGDQIYASMLADIAGAKQSIRVETYAFENAGIGIRLCNALVEAARRDVSVRVLVDGFGSSSLPDSFWQQLRNAGGKVRIFNPLRPRLFSIRDHRKLLVCDDLVSYVGGYNISPEYEGDGIDRGWCDVGLRVSGGLSAILGSTFDRMFDLSALRRKSFIRLRRAEQKAMLAACGCRILLGGPGRGASPLLRALRHDLSRARSVRIMVAYFLPTRRLRQAIRRVARRGARVELLLPGKSDVTMSKLATESLYRRLLMVGVRIFEYQPQMLHGKLFIVDNAVYVGSSNLDPRSLRMNYELMVRLESPEVAADANAIFDECLGRSREVQKASWLRQRSIWTRLRQRFAHLIMSRLDPWVVQSQWHTLPD